jgi:hypothetical protein
MRHKGILTGYYLQKQDGGFMKKIKDTKDQFRTTLERYLGIKGLDIVVYLLDGKTVELFKNRSLIKDEIVMFDGTNREKRIPLSMVKSIDLFAA